MLNTLLGSLLEKMVEMRDSMSANLMPDIVKDDVTSDLLLIIRQAGRTDSGRMVVVAQSELGPNYPVLQVLDLISKLNPAFLDSMNRRMLFANGGTASIKLSNQNRLIQVEVLVKGVPCYEHWDIAQGNFVEAYGM